MAFTAARRVRMTKHMSGPASHSELLPTSTNDGNSLLGAKVGHSLGGFAESSQMPSRTNCSTALILV
jgi:hypothetical protein